MMRDFAFVHPTHTGKRAGMPLAMFGRGPRAWSAIKRASLRLPSAGVRLVQPPVLITAVDEQSWEVES